MTPGVRVAAIIPARMASSRLPGKPLLDIRGVPMVEHVRRRAAMCTEFTDVVVATCDREIADAVARYGGRVIMTSVAHLAATDRVAEAAEKLDCTHVVNVQGDEALVLPADLTRLVRAIAGAPDAAAWNAVARLETTGELTDPAIVKCVVSAGNRILYCSRNFSHLRLEGRFEPVRRILGVIAYRRGFLARYGQLSRTPLEIAESIDQSRILEHDERLQAVDFQRGYPGINEPGEAKQVQWFLTHDETQRDVLRAIGIA